MRTKLIPTTLLFLLDVLVLAAQEISIIPQPKTVEKGTGYFVLNEKTSVCYDNPELKSLAEYFSHMVLSFVDVPLMVNRIQGEQSQKRAINLILDTHTETGKEGYRLSVTLKQVTVKSSTVKGLFYGVQSLLQLIPLNGVKMLPCLEISDEPRFPWRGLMFDVSRHFCTIDELKTLIDQMAMYKFNVFHLHLTDDQGWRIEIKSFPKLTSIGSWRVPRIGVWKERELPLPGEKPTYGGFYSQNQIRDLVKYASERNIQIMPEIDVPGHSMSAIVAYPNLSCTRQQYQIPINSNFYTNESNVLCAGRDSTFEFLDKVLDEVVALFPFDYVHIGGDECYKGFWAKCPDCQKRMKENNLADTKELQSYFVRRVGKMLEGKGRKLVGWGEILEGGLASNSTVMSWIDMKAGIEAARHGNDVIMTPRFPTYMDYYQGDPCAEPIAYRENRLKTCYHFEPVPDSIPAGLIIGGQTCLWGEFSPNFRHAQYLLWPRSMALAEVYWSPKSGRNWNDFIARLEPQLRKFDKLDYKYSSSYLDAVVKPTLDKYDHLRIQLGTEIDDLDIYYTFDNSFPDQHSLKYRKGELLEIPKTASSFIVVTYRGKKQIGKIISIPIEDLKKRTQIKPIKGALDFEFE